MGKANLAIRNAMNKADVKQWEVARACGILESNFSRILRVEMPLTKQNEIISIINQLKKNRK